MDRILKWEINYFETLENFQEYENILTLPVHAQVNIDKAELEDARWFTYEEITEALQNLPRDPRREPPVFWVPPSYAIANQLLQEWANHQQLSRKLHGLK